MFKVADIHKMRIYVQVPQQLSAGIRPGLTADLTLPQYPDKTFKSTIATTSSAINMSCAHFARRVACGQSGWPAAARRLRSGDVPTADRPERGADSDKRAIVSGARTASRNARSRGQDRAEVGQARTKSRNRRRSREAASRLPIGSSTVRRIRSRLATWCTSPNSLLRQTRARLTHRRLNDLARPRHSYRIWPSSPSLPLPRPQGAAPAAVSAPPTGRRRKANGLRRRGLAASARRGGGSVLIRM